MNDSQANNSDIDSGTRSFIQEWEALDSAPIVHQASVVKHTVARLALCGAPAGQVTAGVGRALVPVSP